MTPKRWILVAIAFRLIAVGTNFGTNHPDEWFQTVEFGNFLAFGFASQSGEFLIHMRNLTWPAILALPLRFAHWLSGGDVAARMYAVKMTTALVDLTLLWGLAKMLASDARLTPVWRNAGWALFVLPWFLVAESVRPSQEHLSSIACWWMLGFLAIRPAKPAHAVAAGAAMVMTGAFRFASGLFGVGALIAVILQFARDSHAESRPRLGHVFAGIGLGLFLGGLADWVFYGRPWESLYMYTQYNVFTGLSVAHFGSQPMTEYWPFFRGLFKGPLLPLGLAALLLIPVGITRGLARLQPWAFALVTFLAGHLLISHKEPRFMAPTIGLVLWALLEGSWTTWHLLRAPLARVRWARPALRALIAFALVANGALLLRALWGETWRAGSNYLDVSRLLSNHPSCAVVSVRRPVAGLVPWSDPGRVPEPAVGFFPAPSHQPSSASLKERPVVWLAHAPDCGSGQRVLFQPYKPESYWKDVVGCELLPSGVLKVLPTQYWPKFIEKDWVSAPWYSCPSSLLSLFKGQEVRTVVATRMRRLTTLPPLGINGEEFLNLAWGELDRNDPANRDGSFGDW